MFFVCFFVFFFKQKTAYEMRISDWSSDVCSSDLFLIDLFYAGLPLPESKPGSGVRDGKRRTHFHRFMRGVHERLRAHAGERDPLVAIAREWRQQLRVLVLDEFFVSDIGDAMLLGRLLERMFAEGVVLVTSSNTAPENLYKGGLQRARFKPAIALIEKHRSEEHMQSDTAYRLRELTRSPVYRAPLDDELDAWLESSWPARGGDNIIHGSAHRERSSEPAGRKMATRDSCKGLATFDAAALRTGSRGATA